MSEDSFTVRELGFHLRRCGLLGEGIRCGHETGRGVQFRSRRPSSRNYRTCKTKVHGGRAGTAPVGLKGRRARPGVRRDRTPAASTERMVALESTSAAAPFRSPTAAVYEHS